MNNVSNLELNTHLFKIYCSDKILNTNQQHILVNYIGKMTYVMRTHHLSMSNVDLDYRRAFVEFIKFAHTKIKSQSEFEYWFRILFNAMQGEQHLGLATIYMDMIDEVLAGITEKPQKFDCVRRIIFKKHSESPPNFMDYIIRMYHQNHQNINWPMFVDGALCIIDRCIIYYNNTLTNTLCTYDSRLIHVLFLFLNHDDNQELFMDILLNLNTILHSNIVDYNPQLYQELFTSHNLLAISNLPTLFNGDESIDIQMSILTFFNIIFEMSLTENVFIPKEVVINTLSLLNIYHEIQDVLIVFKFASLAFKYYPDIDYNIEQIKAAIDIIEDLDNDDIELLSHTLLNYILDVLIYTRSQPSLVLQTSVFEPLVHNYQFLTMTPKSRMLMSLIVYEFVKVGHVHPELKYSDILQTSGYLNILDEDDNIYNRDLLLKIKYNYICTSLQDKCKEWILDNQDSYHPDQVQDVMDIL